MILEDIVKESSVIIDIGANIGQTFVEYKKLNQKAAILSIEANPKCEKALIECGATYKILALGDNTESKNFYINKNEPTCQGASFYKETTEYYKDGNFDVINVPTVTLDSITGSQYFDLIKIDTQGSECAIINGGIETLKRTKWLLIELPVTEYNAGAASSNEIIEKLHSIGFVPHTFIKDNVFQGTVVQKDVLFVNTKYDSENLTDDSPRKTLGVKFDFLCDVYKKIKPDYYVEIGAFKCQTSVGLFKEHLPIKAYLLDLFAKAPDEELPPNDVPINAELAISRIQENFGDEFDCAIVVGDSSRSMPAVAANINSQETKTAFIFVDGGHSYFTTIQDLINTSTIKHSLVVAIDDANWGDISVAVFDFVKFANYRNPKIIAARPNMVILKLDPYERNT